MKQKMCITFYAIIVAIILCSATTVFADAHKDVIVNVDGIELGEKGVIINSRTLVPVRALAEALNVIVDWDETSRMVTLSKPIYRVNRLTGEESVVKRDIYMWIDKLEVSIDGQTFPLDVPPQIIESKTMLPARAVCEWFEATVEWDGDTGTVIVTRGANDSFAEARIQNAEIELTERNVIDSIINEEQNAVVSAIDEINIWISEDKLSDSQITFVYGFSATALRQVTGFYSYGGLDGSGGTLVYAVPDFDDSLDDGDTKSYNGVTVKRDRGTLFFSRANLQDLGILK